MSERGNEAGGVARWRRAGALAGLAALIASGLAVSSGVGVSAAADQPAQPGAGSRSAPAELEGRTVHLAAAQAQLMRARLSFMLRHQIAPDARRLVDAATPGADSVFPPLNLANITTIDLNGNLTTASQTVLTATTSTVSAAGHPTTVTVASAGYSVTLTTVSALGLMPGVYYSLDGDTVTDTVCGNSGSLLSIFEIDQATYNGANQPTSFGVQYESFCGTGDIVYGTFAYRMPNTANQGYYLWDEFGDVAGFGNNDYLLYLGSPGTQLVVNAPVIDMVTTPDGNGYWMLGSDGGIFAYGAADFHGSMAGLPLNAPIVGMASTTDGNGYWLVGSDGGVFTFGDAVYHGSMGGQHLNAPIIGITADPNGYGGYWMVAADGGLFGFGKVGYFGSTGNIPLIAPIVGMATTSNGLGYWFVASDGGVFAFGTAGYHGSMGGQPLSAPIVGFQPSQDDGGYWLVGSDGGVFTFGDAVFHGSEGEEGLPGDISGIAA